MRDWSCLLLGSHFVYADGSPCRCYFKKQAAPMQDPDRAALQAAVELLHSCQATFLRTECVRVTSGSVTSESEVAIFTLGGRDAPAPLRSEEHTAELQSLAYLVCRLLLEK